MSTDRSFTIDTWYRNDNPRRPLIFSLIAHQEAIEAMCSHIQLRFAVPFISIDPDPHSLHSSGVKIETASEGVFHCPHIFGVPRKNILATHSSPINTKREDRWCWTTAEKPKDEELRGASKGKNPRPLALIEISVGVKDWRLSGSRPPNEPLFDTRYDYVFEFPGEGEDDYAQPSIFIPEYHLQHGFVAAQLIR